MITARARGDELVLKGENVTKFVHGSCGESKIMYDRKRKRWSAVVHTTMLKHTVAVFRKSDLSGEELRHGLEDHVKMFGYDEAISAGLKKSMQKIEKKKVN